jgi:hypothetical protein
MNQARLRGLALVREQARAAGRRPDARALLASFVETSLGHARSGRGERHFMALVVRSFSDTDHTVQRAFESYMRPAFEALRAAMAEALPDLPSAELWWRLQFTIGAMIRVQHLALAAVAAETTTPQPPNAAATRLLTDFVHAGLTAPSAAQPRPRHTAPAQGESA